MNDEQIQQILADHSAWLRGEGGKCANLRNAYLRNADLRDADLHGADLRGADLRYSNLRSANLRYSNLRNAYLRNADLRSANLSGANLRNANLSGADLRGADLRYSNLRSANLRYSNLRNADLHGADLTDAQLSGAGGIRYVAITAHWHGERGRQILAVDHGEEGVIIHCGCFRGTWEELNRYIEDGDETLRASRYQIAAVLRMLWDAPDGAGGE